MRRKIIAAVSMLGLFAALCSRVHGADYTVNVYHSFSPSSLTINVGDSVTWVNLDEMFSHTTTSDSYVWNGTLVDYYDSFTWTFDTPGTYPYSDLFDGFSGTITVRSANTAPSVSITNPVSGAVFRAPASFTIGASASDSDGSVSSVQFFVGSSSYGSDTSAPYQASVSGLAAGSYSISAVATDNLGAKKTNSISIVVNNPPSVSITNPVSGMVFQGPAGIQLKAAASDTDGTISQVQFFSGSASAGTVSIAPYNLALSNLTNGSYAFTARAVDNRGAWTTSSVVNITVTSVSLSGGAFVGDRFQVNASGLVSGKTNILQGSMSLTNWVSLATNIAAGSTATLVHTNARGSSPSRNFYRVVQLP